MFLIDTNVLSERRRGPKADPGVVDFIDRTDHEIFVPVQVIGELFSGVEWLRRRGDHVQASTLDAWLKLILQKYSSRIIAFDLECAAIWGSLMGVNDQHIVDRQIAAIALTYDLTVVTRNTSHFAGTGARTLNPFLADKTPGQPIT
ncbi:MAG TPA: type II toxin-antitoxin system VapC family toxin [Terracidiphilus sp.]|nr:type II toxin-antitoxin system VapC family toxin [Terracidiphilus sp.]